MRKQQKVFLVVFGVLMIVIIVAAVLLSNTRRCTTGPWPDDLTEESILRVLSDCRGAGGYLDRQACERDALHLPVCN
jgi:hypothetical protein